MFGEPPRERADAARNRSLLLAAAEGLFAERGIDHVSMDDIARAAGVGKGTLYRRFGDKSGLGIAILDDRERDLQDAILGGPPPLGPGASPAARLHAFADAYLSYLDRNLDLVVMSETASPGARYRTGVYAGWLWHVQLLLSAGGWKRPRVLAACLLGALSADLHRHLRAEGTPHREVEAALHDLIDRLIGER